VIAQECESCRRWVLFLHVVVFFDGAIFRVCGGCKPERSSVVAVSA
jgi:hypothetical protein